MSKLEQKCPIWGTEARMVYLHHQTLDLDIESPRAGGTYIITDQAKVKLDSSLDRYRSDNIFKAKLTTWLIQETQKKGIVPEINLRTLRLIRNRELLPIEEKINNLLKYIYKRNQRCGDRASFGEIKEEENLKAHSECTSDEQWKVIKNFVREMKYIKYYLFDQQKKEGIHILVDGYKRLESFEKNTTSNQAFLAMWFDESMNEFFKNGFEPAIRDAGYNCMRIDKKEHNNQIDDEIIAEVKRSRFLVADFTQKDKDARGGVYYEAGFAHGLGIPTIFTCREDSKDNLHFDTRQYNHIIWENSEDLKKQLKYRICATIGDGSLRRSN